MKLEVDRDRLISEIETLASFLMRKLPPSPELFLLRPI